MIYTVKFTTALKKSYKLIKQRGLDLTLLDEVVDSLRQGKILNEKYKDRALKGEYSEFRECHIKSDWLLIYIIEDDVLTLNLVDTGSHSDFFKYIFQAPFLFSSIRNSFFIQYFIVV